MTSVVLFGELMLRLNTKELQRLVQASEFRAYYTGAEANVGASLATWGCESMMVSRVPDHDLGQACVNFLRSYGIDTRHVQRGPGRLGILYVELGASQRRPKVVYDRAHSAFTAFSDQGLDWNEIMRGRQWFHFAGTALAASPRMVPIVRRASAAARRNGVKVSCDLNFRRTLWTPELARQRLIAVIRGIDLLICNEEQARLVFGFDHPSADVTDRRLSRRRCEGLARRLQSVCKCSAIAITLRHGDSATVSDWSAMLWHGGRSFFSQTYHLYVVDRIGGGDAFAAGLIYGLSTEMGPQHAVEFAAAASCLKHAIPGDFNLATLEEVNDLLAGKEAGRIRR
jgi:2-dehydro-3-deoxygluconokinase